MKKLTFTSALMLTGLLTACNNSNNDGPQKPNLCNDLSIAACNEFSGVTSTDSSSSSSGNIISKPEHITNQALPIIEDFEVSDALTFFTSTYKPLATTVAEDAESALYFSTSGADAGRMAIEDGRFTIGNARFSIGQTLAEGKTKTNSTQATDLNVWGELDLSRPWKLSFCVVHIEKINDNKDNQQFQVYVDNNQTKKDNSIHGADSLVSASNAVDEFAAGQRVEITVPGTVTIGGEFNSNVVSNPGTLASFLQLRVPSAAALTMDDLWLGYQDDTSTEPAASNCMPGERVASWNIVPPPAEPTTAPTLIAGDGQISVQFDNIARASSYNIAYSTADSIEGAQFITADTSGEALITGLTNNNIYYVSIQAVNATATSSFSSSASVRPIAADAAPATPSNLKTVAGDATILINWDDTPATSSYTVAYNTTNSLEGAQIIANITDSRFTLTESEISNGTTYYIFVRASNSAGYSSYSDAEIASPATVSWTGIAVDLFGEGNDASGTVTETSDTVTLRATGGKISSSDAFKTYFAYKPMPSPFSFTARLASVDAADGTTLTDPGTGTSYGFGLAVIEDFTPVDTYASVPRFATIGLRHNGTPPSLLGSRAHKLDAATGSRSRSDVAGLSIGHYMRLEVFVDTEGKYRIKRYTSVDGIEYVQQNSSSWAGENIPENWHVGFFAAPGLDKLAITFDDITLEVYTPPLPPEVSSSSSSSSSGSSSSSNSSSSGASSSSSSTSSSSSSGSTLEASFPPAEPVLSASTANWSVYNGDLAPLAAGAVTLADGTTTAFSDSDGTAATDWVTNQGIASYNSLTDPTAKARIRLDDIVTGTFPQSYTLLARLRNSNSENRGIEIEQSFGGDDGAGAAGRIKFILRENKVQLEKFDGTTTEEFNTDFDASQWHTYQLSVTLNSPREATASLFIDGQVVIDGITTSTLRSTSLDSNRIVIGDGGSSAYNAEVDWIIWTQDDAYLPSHLVDKLPADLGDVSAYVSPAADATWNIYNSELLPTATDAVSLKDGTKAAFSDADGAADSLWSINAGVASFTHTVDPAAKQRVQIDNIVGDTFPKSFTLIARLRNSDITNRGIEIEQSFGGDEGGFAGRVKFILRENKVQLEKFDGTTTEEYGTEFVASDWHIYQLAVTLQSPLTATANLYIDGKLVLEALSTNTLRTTSANKNRLILGDGGSSAYNAELDWVIWTDDGAFTAQDMQEHYPEGLGSTEEVD